MTCMLKDTALFEINELLYKLIRDLHIDQTLWVGSNFLLEDIIKITRLAQEAIDDDTDKITTFSKFLYGKSLDKMNEYPALFTPDTSFLLKILHSPSLRLCGGAIRTPRSSGVILTMETCVSNFIETGDQNYVNEFVHYTRNLIAYFYEERTLNLVKPPSNVFYFSTDDAIPSKEDYRESYLKNVAEFENLVDDFQSERLLRGYDWV